MVRKLALLLPALVAVLVMSGCTPAQFSAFAIRPEGAPAAALPGLLLVEGADGNISTLYPDGSGRVNLTDDARSFARLYEQPVWSPDGARVAFSRVDIAGTETTNAVVKGALVTMAADGSARTELLVDFPPFYMSWSPTGNQIAYLSNWEGLEGPSMALRIFDVAANEATTLAEGSPYYFSWSPAGDALLAHIGTNRMELQTIAGERTTLTQTPADFGAPQWLADATRLVYAVDDGATQEVIVADLEGNPLSQITDFDDRVAFTLSPEGDRIAYVLTAADAPLSNLGPLYVTELESLRTIALPSRTALATFWSPDGSKLAYLDWDPTDEARWLRWHVWDGDKVTDYARFWPYPGFLRSYLPFADQYAQSLHIWSPDSTAFTFAGRVESGASGVFVQQLGAQRARRVADGVIASWSPQ